MSIGNTRRTLTVLSFAPNDVVTATGNETGVDLLDYEGDITMILDAEAGGSGVTYAVKVQDSSDNSTFADVTGAAFTTTSADTALVRDSHVQHRRDQALCPCCYHRCWWYWRWRSQRHRSGPQKYN